MTINNSSPEEPPGTIRPLVGITGPCGAGKTTLAQGLQRRGIQARAIAQEHSYVCDMWQHFTKPVLLVFLQASCKVGGERRKLDWTESEWQEQQRRLEHARIHADLFIDTDPLTIEQVLDRVSEFLYKSSLFREY